MDQVAGFSKSSPNFHFQNTESSHFRNSEFWAPNLKFNTWVLCRALISEMDGVSDGQAFERMKETIIQSNPQPSSTPVKPRRRWSSPVNEVREELPLTERKRALFEPLDPIRRRDNNNLLPPPDFDATTYPSGWVVGKKRKLVNVDVVESMRRIAVHEMNRKDQEIDGLNEQLEEDARCVERLQLQLQQERSKRMELERENSVLQDRIGMLTEMLEENEDAETVDGATSSPSNL